MKNKTCELEIILTNLLKVILLTVLETITQIFNFLFMTGTFPLGWKMAIVRPLLKKAGLRTNQEKLQTFIKSQVFYPSWWSIVC